MRLCALLAVLACVPVLLASVAALAPAAGNDGPDPNYADPGPATADQVNVTAPADPSQALLSGAGVLAGVVVADCGSSPLSGCHGQPMPGIELWIRAPDGKPVAHLQTAADGAFWAPLPPGSYRVEVGQSDSTLEVDVTAGQLVEVEATLRRPAPPR